MNFYEQVYALVRRIPAGRVTTYGRIAEMLDRPRAARAVGYALNALRDRPDDTIPWHRVVGQGGRITIVNREFSADLQAALLRDEGIPVTPQGTLPDFPRRLWGGG
jgi:methylated-DNA-protein-cysteine methyltransferase-like protein